MSGFWALLFASYYVGCYCGDNNNVQNAGDSNRIKILHSMFKWGNEIDKAFPAVNRKQFLVVAVLSDSIRSNPSAIRLEEDCSNGNKIRECRKTAFILNKVDREMWRTSEWANDTRYKQHSWHGEYRMLHAGVLDRLKVHFWEDNDDKTEHCEVYLYSHYIPCAKVSNSPYSCSELIMNYNTNEEKKDSMKCKITVVGHKEVFGLTDENQAKEWMQTGLVELFDLSKTLDLRNLNVNEERKMEGRKRRDVLDQASLSVEIRTLQGTMYTCLRHTPMSQCCVADRKDSHLSDVILAFFINSAVYHCIHDSALRGPVTRPSLVELRRCFSKWLQDNIGSDCRLCSDGSLPSAWYQQFLVGFCIHNAMMSSSTMGRPSDVHDLTRPSWVPWEGPWSTTYIESPDTFQHRRNIVCTNRSLWSGSLCTKSAKSAKKHTEANLLIERYLWP